MPYTLDLPDAARRHLRAANRLLAERRPRTPAERAVAGYLFGLAAELALKAMSESIPQTRRADIFYAHLPDLRDLLQEHAKGRSAARLHNLLTPEFMGGWHVKMRYAPSREIEERDLDGWAKQAARAVNTMESV